MTVFAFKSVDFVSEKGVATKKSLPPVKAFLFFCEIRSSHIFPAVSPHRGLTSKFVIGFLRFFFGFYYEGGLKMGCVEGFVKKSNGSEKLFA